MKEILLWAGLAVFILVPAVFVHQSVQREYARRTAVLQDIVRQQDLVSQQVENIRVLISKHDSDAHTRILALESQVALLQRPAKRAERTAPPTPVFSQW